MKNKKKKKKKMKNKKRKKRKKRKKKKKKMNKIIMKTKLQKIYLLKIAKMILILSGKNI